ETETSKFVAHAVFRNTAGTLSQVGATNPVTTIESDASTTIALEVDGTSVDINVTGPSDETAFWRAEVLYWIEENPAVTETLVLDEISPTPFAAYSVARKLRSAYTGNAIRVRRSSDNEEGDI